MSKRTQPQRSIPDIDRTMTDLNICWLCGLVVVVSERSRDHVIPRSKVKDNVGFVNVVRLAHKVCNERRGNRQPTRPEALAFYNELLAKYRRCRSLWVRDHRPQIVQQQRGYV